MRSLVLLSLSAVLGLPRASAQHEHSLPSEKLGTVVFTTSCSVGTQAQFNRAVALMHSFQFARAIEGFHTILSADPACSMAYWGIALSDWGNPFASGLKSDAQLKLGLEAAEQGRASHPKTKREAAYIEAVRNLFADTALRDQLARKLAYEQAMSAVSTAYPADDEAAIFYALAMASAADPADKTYARQLRAGEILERLYAQHPDHPGLAHYIIHAYDAPPLAARAAGAAQHYGEIAPSTPHALHMPSHTFTRTGDWQASIQSNIASAISARKAAQPADELHASDYLVYAYLQTAQDGSAERVNQSVEEIFSRLDPKMQVGGAGGATAAWFARAAIPARYALERRDWARASTLEPLASPYPYTEAITYFSRGLGAAHLKDTAAGRSALDALGQCRDKLLTMREDYWVDQVEIEREELGAWIAFADGHTEEALAAMRAAADREDRTEKSVITPGPLAPARELLGDMLAESGHPAKALTEFQATLVREPNRFWAIYGAAAAARQAGDRTAAATYLQRLLSLTDRADKPERHELTEARAALQHPE